MGRKRRIKKGRFKGFEVFTIATDDEETYGVSLQCIQLPNNKREILSQVFCGDSEILWR